MARLGLERAKRYLLTGDEIDAEDAVRLGLVLECVPDAELVDRASALAQRMAQLPLNQLQMLKLVCNDVAAQMYRPDTSRLLGTLFDGVARHTQEGLDFVARAQDVGFRQAVRESATTRSATTAAGAGWSSLVARRAHNPKVGGSNPPPATIESAGQRPRRVRGLTVFRARYRPSTGVASSISRANVSAASRCIPGSTCW